MEIEKIKDALKTRSYFLKKKFGVKSIRIFGSYARGEQKESSDLDILVEFEEPIDLFGFVELENYLSDLLGIKVDLTVKGALKSRIRDRILKESIKL